MKNEKKTVTIKGTVYNVEKRSAREGDTIIDVENNLAYEASIMDAGDMHWVAVVPKPAEE